MTRDRPSPLTVLLPCFLLTLLLGLASDGVYHDDDLTHFLVARWAWWFPEYLIHLWGRPGLTIPLASVAYIGDSPIAWHLCRVLSAIVTAAGAMLAAKTAVRLGIARPGLVILFCYLQPLAFLLAGTTLTENFAAFYLIAATYLLITSRPIAASLVFSLVFVTRHEALVLLPVWLLAILFADQSLPRRMISALCSVWTPILHNLLFFACLGAWPFAQFLNARGSTEYLPGGPLSYIPDALYAVPPALAGLALVGAFAMARNGQFLIPSLVFIFFAAHATIKTFGLFASGGYGRFLVAIAPLIAILAAAGFGKFALRFRERRNTAGPWMIFASIWLLGWIAVEVHFGSRLQQYASMTLPSWCIHWALWATRAVVALILILLIVCSIGEPGRRVTKVAIAALTVACALQFFAIVRPMRLRTEKLRVRDTVDWIRAQGLNDAPIFACNPWVTYFLRLVENPRVHKGPRLLASMPVGTIVIWDSIYSPSDFHRIDLDSLSRDSNYQEIHSPDSKSNAVALHVFRKITNTPIPSEPDPTYPPDPMAHLNPPLGKYYVHEHPPQ